MLPRPNPRHLALLFGLVVALMLLALASLRIPVGQVIADEGTYLAMIDSLRLDGDLLFEEADRLRIEAEDERGRQEVILHRNADGGIAYSKPILFPLLALPFSFVLGELGPSTMNILALLVAAWLALRYLAALAEKEGQDRRLGELLMATFLGAAVVVPYVFWRMGDSLQLALALAGLTLTIAEQRLGAAPNSRVGWRGALGMALLAALLALRVSNGVVALMPILAALLGRQLKRAAKLAASLLLAIFFFAALGQVLVGTTNPYRAIRTSFMPETGYPTAIPAAELDLRFDEFRRSHHTEVNTPGAPREAAFAALYFLIGRHTGLFFYFPAACLLLALGFTRRNDAVGLAALLTFGATAAFFVGWKPDNYFGGETFIGNRYLLSYYPVLLFAIPRLPTLKQLLLPWLVAFPCYTSALASELGKGPVTSSQSHTGSGIFALLPFESVAQYIEGTVDRYWAGQLVRFVAPQSQVNSVNFEISSERATEVLLAQWEIPSTLRFFVQTSAPAATFEVEDYRRTQSFAVGAGVVPSTEIGVPVNLRPTRPWRRHLLWFSDRPYYVRVLKLRLRSEQKAKALVTFFGDPLLLEQLVDYQLHAFDWPGEARAGRQDQLRFVIENRGARTWHPADPAAVTGRWRFFRQQADGTFAMVEDSGRIPLPEAPVAQKLEIAFPFRWPREPGIYELEVDLVLDHVLWFQERLGHPVARRRFEVLPSAAPTATATATATPPP